MKRALHLTIITLAALASMLLAGCQSPEQQYVKKAVKLMDRQGLFAEGPEWEEARAAALAAKPVTKEEAYGQLTRLFTDSNVTIIMHNAKFDLKVLYNTGFDKYSKFFSNSQITGCKIYDTMVTAWLTQQMYLSLHSIYH